MAVLIRGERILAANVVLPLSEEMGGVRRYGTRHRAARGITEQSDAVAVVVSEETGAVTMFHDGQMISQLNEERIGVLLVELLRVDTETGREVVA
jgi:DNA integrity scanning protein DisA with diadenylate cyclase activity